MVSVVLAGCSQSNTEHGDGGTRDGTVIRFSDVGFDRFDSFEHDAGGAKPDSARPSPDAGIVDGGGGTPDGGGGTPDGGALPEQCIDDDGNCPLRCQGANDNDCPALIESIIAYGKIWRFDGINETPLAGNGSALRTIPRFAGEPESAAQSPCGSGSDPCTVSDRAWVWFKDVLVDSVGARGRYWNFEGMASTYEAWSDSGSPLHGVDRYDDAGPCQEKGATCAFDTRTFVTLEGHLIESITAYGKGWNFDASENNKPWDQNGSDLTVVPRFRDGPCHERAAGTCAFDTRTFVTLEGHLIESITAYGKGWNFDASEENKPWDTNGYDLTTVARFRDGPCQGRAAGTCTFDSRSFIDAR